ncbi:MAG: PepSY-like domain-containing protein [Spirochaetia bacterium]|nr:PepSY-like domain-containing protein [Spirochaetia bacterium]
MKKITMITAIFLLVLSATFADKVISADQLSAGAKDFISKTFPGKTVQYVEADFSSYEVVLNDGTEIDMKISGEWETIKSYTGVPASVIPAAITTYVTTNYPDTLIIEVESNWNNFELKLTNRWELFFDKDGKFLGQKFDD